ncbi:EAL domain-containing protein [Shewanella sp. GXUN23E]|uniref:EAL domain-containing protein n=1 Tax=Shewanella sp. GXUN23E TaxID=3422498 RepID=UPI003D7C3E15
MGIRIPFHLILLATFAGLLAFQYQDTRRDYEQLVAAQAQLFHETLQQHSSQASGEALYKALSQQISLQFFQYIDNEDSRANFTFGALSSTQSPLLDSLFPLENRFRQPVPPANLQVALNRPAQTSDLMDGLTRTAILYLGAYLLLAITFTLLMGTLKQRIRYAARYIADLPKLEYNNFAASKLSGLLSPLSEALDSCRRELKKTMEASAAEHDQLQRVAFHDYLTGFGTPQKFSAKLNSIAKDDKPRLGIIAQVKATELAAINQDKGRTAGDDYLLDIANTIRTVLQNVAEAESFRISSGDFAIYIPDLSINQAEAVLGKLKVGFNDIQVKYQTDSIAYTGAVPCQTGAEPSVVLGMLDTAITIALTQSPNTVFIMEKAPDDAKAGEHQWQTIINAIIDSRSIGFHQQPIQSCRSGTEGYTELLARFYNHAGNVLPTQTVLAMAKRYEMSVQVDKAIMTSVLQILEQNPTLSGHYGINISGSSIADPQFLSWMKNALINRRALAARLVFEVAESSMQTNLLAAARFVKLAHALGAKVSVEQFGHGFTSFKFFREVLPDYIKLDGSYSQRIDEDGNNRFYVRTLVDISRRAGIQVVATAVERQEEKIELEKLLVDGLQGFYIARPQELPGSRKAM